MTPERSSSPCSTLGRRSGKSAGSLLLRHELLARPADVVREAQLDLEQRAELPGEPHLLDHPREQRLLERAIELAGEDGRQFASPGIGSATTMCVRSIRGRSSAAIPSVLVGPLRAQPERERGDLRASGVDVHAVEVVLEDQRWERPRAAARAPDSPPGACAR